MDAKTRKSLKKDEFAEELKHGFDFMSTHQDDVKKWGAVALGVVIIAAGIFFYMRYQADAREKALSEAIKVENAHIGPAPPGFVTFPTQEEKDKARAKAFADVASKYSGSQEGGMAELYLASEAIEKGNLPEAEKHFKHVADTAPAAVGSMARLALAKVYAGDGRDDQAIKILEDLAAHPTVTVSKEQATIQMAVVIGKKDPERARKILEPMRTERTAISRAAVQALGEVAGAH